MKKVCYVFSLESPHRGNSNEYTQYTIFIIKKEITQISPNLHLWDFPKRLKNEFETAVVNEPSVFEPLKVYCKKNFKSKCEYAKRQMDNL